MFCDTTSYVQSPRNYAQSNIRLLRKVHLWRIIPKDDTRFYSQVLVR